MAVGDDFSTFCANLTVPQDDRTLISSRYKAITKCLNARFYETASDTDNSRYYGSYGRGTAIRGFSDLDLIYSLPIGLFSQYNNHQGNGQSALLQKVREVLHGTYATTDVGADGQVVVVRFSDGKVFDVLPAFDCDNDKFVFPDATDGGRWRETQPVPEREAIAKMDKDCNGNLKWLCRMIRAWRECCNVAIKGLLIDTLAYRFLEDWEYRALSYSFYQWMSHDFFAYLANQNAEQSFWLAPGSSQFVYRHSDKFEYKAKCALTVCSRAIEDGETYPHLRRSEWRSIYGTMYPAS